MYASSSAGTRSPHAAHTGRARCSRHAQAPRTAVATTPMAMKATCIGQPVRVILLFVRGIETVIASHDGRSIFYLVECCVRHISPFFIQRSCILIASPCGACSVFVSVRSRGRAASASSFS